VNDVSEDIYVCVECEDEQEYNDEGVCLNCGGDLMSICHAEAYDTLEEKWL